MNTSHQLNASGALHLIITTIISHSTLHLLPFNPRTTSNITSTIQAITLILLVQLTINSIITEHQYSLDPKALAIRQLTSYYFRTTRIQQPLLLPQSYPKSSPPTYLLAYLHLSSISSTKNIPTSNVLPRLHVTSLQLSCGFTVKKSLHGFRFLQVIHHIANHHLTLRHQNQPIKTGKGRGSGFQKTTVASTISTHPLNL